MMTISAPATIHCDEDEYKLLDYYVAGYGREPYCC